MAKKQPPKAQAALKSVAKGPSTLTELEAERMERFRLLKDMRAQEDVILTQRARILELQKQNFDLLIGSLKNQDAEVSRDKAGVRAKAAKDKEGQAALMDSIRERLGMIPGQSFGYNPDNLEVITD